MAVCDICSVPGIGTLVSAEQMREAVFANGFNPFALGLVRNPMSLLLGAGAYDSWKTTIVAQDTSDWNVCSQCMTKIQPFLRGAPKPTGVRHATVSANPLVGLMAGAAAEQRYKRAGEPKAPAEKKRWWQFWK